MKGTQCRRNHFLNVSISPVAFRYLQSLPMAYAIAVDRGMEPV